ncbi:hypothetical protein KRP22_014967 [Phytophthora ramorum]|uniref:uncharacterized protein n=1 Tax=Phytophthora ramorum TaxID=164328 RepID=UPI003097144C|nr:hypothetical protein KRP23_11959 [Phytophthora ramorum]KAH7496082.1 hypothetical protein KRP22_13976 [Phytophthora ramorum]
MPLLFVLMSVLHTAKASGTHEWGMTNRACQYTFRKYVLTLSLIFIKYFLIFAGKLLMSSFLISARVVFVKPSVLSFSKKVLTLAGNPGVFRFWSCVASPDGMIPLSSSFSAESSLSGSS